MKKVLCLAPVLWTLSATPALGYDVGGYAVSNFRPCGEMNLPATVRELQRFFDSRDFPTEARKNFLWTNSQVKQVDWAAATDYTESDATANQFNGVDANLVSYIASHGITWGGVYSAVSGTPSYGGCDIDTPDLSLGDQSARYVILSTCQGLKIGSGDNPSRRGEDPSTTWATSAPGLNCILGYSNNMSDASGYGEYLLDLLADGDTTLADAFFEASRQASYSNIPAAMCFGETEEAARHNLETISSFSEEYVGGSESVWTYQYGRQIEGTFGLPQTKSVTPGISVFVPHAELERLSSNGVFRLNQERGILTYSAPSKATTEAIQLSDDVVINRATQFLNTQGFSTQDWRLQPTYILEQGTKVRGEKVVTKKTVVMHQEIQGISLLGTSGSVTVEIDAHGNVTRAILAPRVLASQSVKSPVVADELKVITAENTALENLSRRFPGANLTIKDVRVGYDSASYLEPNAEVKAVVEVSVEVAQGRFARIFAERIAL